MLRPSELRKVGYICLGQEASQLPLILCNLCWLWGHKNGFCLGFLSELNFKSSKMGQALSITIVTDPCHLDVLTLIFYSTVHWLTFPSLNFTYKADWSCKLNAKEVKPVTQKSNSGWVGNGWTGENTSHPKGQWPSQPLGKVAKREPCQCCRASPYLRETTNLHYYMTRPDIFISSTFFKFL